VNRLFWRAARAAATGALVLLTSFTLALAQDAPPVAPPAPAEDSTAPPQPDAAAPPQASPAPASTDPAGCKGLEEKPCRKNKACVWIIPKEPDKAGNVKPPYCHKHGSTKKKPKTTGGAAAPDGAAQAAPPAAEQAPPAPPPEQSPGEMPSP
jgi:hypothetical protein